MPICFLLTWQHSFAGHQILICLNVKSTVQLQKMHAWSAYQTAVNTEEQWVLTQEADVFKEAGKQTFVRLTALDSSEDWNKQTLLLLFFPAKQE